MKILFLTNNIDVTAPLIAWLKQVEGGENVTLWNEAVVAALFSADGALFGTDFVISYNYTHIIRQDVISLFPHKIINLHTSMLPWNRGSSPNLWSFLEGTPSGVTIHEIDEGVDTGDILIQREIIFDYTQETLKTSYEKSHTLIRQLFCDNWDKLKNGLVISKPQTGTMHLKIDSHVFKHIINYDDTIEEFIRKVSCENGV